MFLCNTSAIKDWSYFLSQILPLVNRTAGLVHMDQAEDVATTAVAALQPDSDPPLHPNRTSGMEHVFYPDSDLVYTDYRTPARDPIPLPNAVLYLVMAALVVVAVVYGIVGHLVKDVINEFVGGGRSVVAEGDGGETGEPDWVFGSRRSANRHKTEISYVTSNMNEMSELAEVPRLVEVSYVPLNHTNCLSSDNTRQETVVTIDETLQQRPPDTHAGT